jgi:hypothetical protein
VASLKRRPDANLKVNVLSLQGLKPAFLLALGGAAEAAPFQGRRLDRGFLKQRLFKASYNIAVSRSGQFHFARHRA